MAVLTGVHRGSLDDFLILIPVAGQRIQDRCIVNDLLFHSLSHWECDSNMYSIPRH
jgi:hypothetical protein